MRPVEGVGPEEEGTGAWSGAESLVGPHRTHLADSLT